MKSQKLTFLLPKIIAVLAILTAGWMVSVAFGQNITTLNLGTQSRNPDFATLTFTRPVSVGTTPPSTCVVGQLFFNSASTAGGNLFACTGSNVWTVIGNQATGGTSGNATTIQGITVVSTVPVNNQALLYNSGSAAYVPSTLYTLQSGMGTTATGSGTLQVNVSMGIRSVTVTTDAVLPADCGGLVTYNNASAVAVSLSQPSLGGNFLSGCPVTFRNYGAGLVTITPANSTVGGTATQTVAQGKGCQVVSDGTNWQTGVCN